MSSYLQNLIAKNFNQVEVARPRLASLFEPLSPPPLATPAEIHPVETLDFEQAPDDARSTRTTRADPKARQLKKDLPLPTRNQPSQEPEAPVWRGNQQAVMFKQQSAEPQILEPQISPQKPIAFQPSGPREIEEAREESESSKRRSANFDESGTQPRRQSEEERPPEETLLSGRARMKKEPKTWSQPGLQPPAKKPLQTPMHKAPGQIRRPINELTPKQEAKEANLTDLPDAVEVNQITVQPRIALRVESHKASGNLTPAHHLPMAQPGEIQAAPTINVTIGRIEVRATTPAVQPRKQASGAQTMSLDEYLRKRNRGGAK